MRLWWPMAERRWRTASTSRSTSRASRRRRRGECAVRAGLIVPRMLRCEPLWRRGHRAVIDCGHLSWVPDLRSSVNYAATCPGHQAQPTSRHLGLIRVLVAPGQRAPDAAQRAAVAAWCAADPGHMCCRQRLCIPGLPSSVTGPVGIASRTLQRVRDARCTDLTPPWSSWPPGWRARPAPGSAACRDG
jgi:hypothetical protein